MAVSIHHVTIGLVWIDSTGNVIVKNDTATKLSDFTKGAIRQEHRIFPNLTGPGSTANSDGYPTIAAYLDLEAGDDHAFAYMDQTQVVTQMIT
jgi:hypothetical protein